MTRVLTICGSLGDRSANRAALDVIDRVLTADGAQVIHDELLGSIPPLHPDRVDDPPEAVAAFRAQIAAADAVIIAAPEYAGGLAGATKNALDWVVGSGEFYGKRVGILSAGTSGGTHALHQLSQTLAWQGAVVVAQLGISAPRPKMAADGTFDDAATIESITSLARAVLIGDSDAV